MRSYRPLFVVTATLTDGEGLIVGTWRSIRAAEAWARSAAIGRVIRNDWAVQPVAREQDLG